MNESESGAGGCAKGPAATQRARFGNALRPPVPARQEARDPQARVRATRIRKKGQRMRIYVLTNEIFF